MIFENKMKIPTNKSNKKFNWKLICMLMFRAHDYAGVYAGLKEREKKIIKEHYAIIVLCYTHMRECEWIL